VRVRGKGLQICAVSRWFSLLPPGNCYYPVIHPAVEAFDILFDADSLGRQSAVKPGDVMLVDDISSLRGMQ
jgi:hypothetical protein